MDDQDGGVTIGSVQVTVINLAPIVRVSANQSTIDEAEGSLITVVAIDTGDQGDLEFSFGCTGDGVFEFGPQAGSTHTCFFPDDPLGTPDIFTVVVKVEDDGGAITIGSTPVTVNNLPPVIVSVTTFPSVIPSTGGGTSDITVNAFDPASDDALDLLYSFDCNGDGDFDDPGDFKDQGSTDPDATCTFTSGDIGANVVKVRVLDQDGGIATGDTLVVVGTPAPPTDLSPDRESADPDATFEWLPDKLGKYYDIQISTSDQLNSSADFVHLVRDIRDILHIGGSGDKQSLTLSSTGLRRPLLLAHPG